MFSYFVVVMEYDYMCNTAIWHAVAHKLYSMMGACFTDGIAPIPHGTPTKCTNTTASTINNEGTPFLLYTNKPQGVISTVRIDRIEVK